VTLSPGILGTIDDTAHHEAAHAVIAHLVGGYVTSLRLGPRDGESGSIVYAIKIEERTGTDLDPRIPVLLAGYAASLINLTQREAPEFHQDDAVAEVIVDTMADVEAGLASHSPGNDLERALPLINSTDRIGRIRHVAIAEALVRQHWPIIHAVAVALLENGHLSESNFQTLIWPWIDSGTLPGLSDDVRLTGTRETTQ